MQAAAMRAAIEGELKDNLLPFWRERSEDHERGGFIAEMANDGTVRADAPRGLVLNSRLLWTFSALYRRLADSRDLELARRAYASLESTFGDHEHAGYLWRVDPDGRPLERTKKIYGQAFCIYALTEYHLATGEQGALEAARLVYELIEHHAHDAHYGGYVEARAADWSKTADLRLSDVDMNAAKSMNTHLHLLEAYTNLYRVWPNADVAARLRELVEMFGRHILDLGDGAGRGHLRHFFDEDWRVLSDTCTYGHDIEASWLLCEAAEVLARTSHQSPAAAADAPHPAAFSSLGVLDVPSSTPPRPSGREPHRARHLGALATNAGEKCGLDDERLATSVREWALELARAALSEAVDDDGGLAYEGRNGIVIDPRRDWWCQAEAVVGFWNAFRLTDERAFADAAHRAWRFIDGRVVDRSGGDWFSRVNADGTVDADEPKVSEWKGPYHSVRMCLEMMRRIGADGT